MYVLPNGKAYAAGTKSTTYLLDLLSGTWTTARQMRSAAMSTLSPRQCTRRARSSAPVVSSRHRQHRRGRYERACRAVAQLSPMNHARRRHNLTILADGTVMAVGGTARSDDLSGAVL